MAQPPPHPQTLASVLRYIVLAMVLFSIVPAVMRQYRGDPPGVAQSILTGASFGLVMVAMNYYRLAPNDRLPPPHAIGVGALSIALVVTAIVTWAHEDPIAHAWRSWIPGAALSLPGAYLIAAGTLQWRKAVRAAPDRR